MQKKDYDLIFGIGQTCGCTQSLRRAGLQHLSFPGDWTAPLWKNSNFPPHFDHDLRERVDVLCEDRGNFFDPKALIPQGAISNTGKAVYINTSTHYIFNHDFPVGCRLANELPKVVEKYRRRRARLFELIRSSRRVLAVRMDAPGDKHPTSIDDCRYARRRLNERFAPARIDLLLFSYDPKRPFEQRTFEEVEDGIFRISFDYLDHDRTDLPFQPVLALTGAALAESFSVRDYRSAEERQRHERDAARKKAARRRERWVQRLVPLLNWLHGRHNRLDDLLARIRQRKFEQIAILGFNCEPAFRFYCKWGFLDSSLFAWANTLDLMHLITALNDLSRLGTGELEFHERSRMWRCKNSGIYFHGRMKAIPGAPLPTEAELSADREDLRARLAHLKEKFVGYAVNDKSTLFVHRLGADADQPELDRKLAALESALENLGARNWKLLVICERRHLHRMPSGPHRIFRAVSQFNPVAEVTVRQTGDPRGWDRIFTEFAPLHMRAKAHAFKFEDT